GIPTGGPSRQNPFLDLLRFTRAPVEEEIVFRIIPIGIFLVTYIYFSGRRLKPDFSWWTRLKISLLSVFQPEEAKKKVGLRTIRSHGLLDGIVWAEWIIVILTSFLFGVAHYFGGWGPGKISQATLSGAVFAIAYLYYGIQAPILLHWQFNYYFTVFELSSEYYFHQIDLLSMSWAANIFLGTMMCIMLGVFGVFTILGILRGKRGVEQ
ncbi:MAG: CPBP family intramembrane metalloprotease, partial [Candidatus Bathyarchaeota archaeon]